MAWKFHSGSSLAKQIADRLRRDILNGVYAAGSQFPTVRQLAEEAGVNPNTMQKSLSLLECEELLLTNSTVGRTVTDSSAVILSARRREIDSFTSSVINEAKEMSLNVDELINNIKKGWDSNE